MSTPLLPVPTTSTRRPAKGAASVYDRLCSSVPRKPASPGYSGSSGSSNMPLHTKTASKVAARAPAGEIVCTIQRPSVAEPTFSTRVSKRMCSRTPK
jgi:hypothetical protein